MLTNLAIYWPIVYKEVYEKDILVDIENPLFDKVLDETNKAEFAQFILTAGAETIKLWEDIFGIIAAPNIESMPFRRQRIINRFTTVPPFTLKFLIQRMNDIFGADTYELEMNYDQYRLDLRTHTGTQGALEELIALLLNIIPANIVYLIENTLFQDLNGNLYIAAFLDQEHNYTLSTYMFEHGIVDATENFLSANNRLNNYILTNNIFHGNNLNNEKNILQINNDIGGYDLSSNLFQVDTLLAQNSFIIGISPCLIYNIQ